MRHDYLRIIYANDCASGIQAAHRQWFALFCTMLLSSIKLNPAHPCLSFSCLPFPFLFLPSLAFPFPAFPFSAFPSLSFPFSALPFLPFLSFSSLFPLFPLFSFLFPSFSFLFSLSSLNFCPQSLSPISFCLIFAKNRRNKDCLWTKRR